MAEYQGIEVATWVSGKYTRDVKAVLKPISENPAGAALLKAIAGANKNKGKIIRISPYRQDRVDEDAGLYGKCNAHTEPDDPDAAHTEGKPYYLSKSDDPKTKKDERYDISESKGTERGSNTGIHFTPDMWGASAPCSRGVFGAMPDEVLFHELVHALRDLEAHDDAVPTTGDLLGYRNEEEYLAIVVTNVYMSAKYGDRGKDRLRAGVEEKKALAAPLNTSDGFLKVEANRTLLGKLSGQEKDLFSTLTLVPAKYNPIRELLQPKKNDKPKR